MKTKTKRNTGKKLIPKATKIAAELKIKESKEKCVLALRAYAKCGVMTKAAREAGISRNTLAGYLKKYPKFANRWHEAYEEYLDSLEEIADYRARAYSDKLLQFLLTGGRKNKYGTGIVNNNNVNATANLQIDPGSLLTLANEMAKRMDTKVRHNIPFIEAEYEVIGEDEN